MMYSRRLYRIPSKGMIGGVCSGLGEYFNIDALLFRVLFVILALSTFGGGVLLYMICWIFIPEDNYNFKKNYFKDKEFNDDLNNNDYMENEDDFKRGRKSNIDRNARGNATAGVILILFGVLFLIGNLIPHYSFGYLIRTYWPVIFIIVGVSIVFGSKKKSRK
ncbi:MAG: PspC domain-containing protein [Bacteroidales bacterium]